MGSMNYIRSVDDAFRMMRWLGERHEIVALDTETTGLDVHDPDFRVRLVQIGDANDAWVFPLDQWRGLAKEMLDRYEGVWALHNAPYDVSALRQEGLVVPWSQIDDTMIALRLAEPTQSAQLKTAAGLYVAPGAALAQQDLHKAMNLNGWDWATIPLEYDRYIYYAAMDVILTSRLWAHPVVQRGIASPVYAMEMEVAAICERMELNGMRIDRSYCIEQRASLMEYTNSLRTWAQEHHGILIGSTDQLSHWLLDNGAVITKQTPTGAPSTAKDQMGLLTLQGGKIAEMAKAVLAYRQNDKIVGTYLNNFIGFADEDDILHPSIQTLAARTGRMSIRRPALQTLPKPGDSPESRLVRQAVIPWEDNEVLISSDFEQIEMRLAADLSRDEGLINAFAIADADPSADFFAEMGKIVYTDPSFTKKDPRRKVIKGTMYGMLYGAGPEKLAITAGITVDQARTAKNSIMDSFPGLRAAMTTAERSAKQNGYVDTMFGRRLKIDEGKSYAGLNAIIQGSAADLFKRSMVYLAHAGFEEYMVVPVHDEMVFSIPEALVPEAQQEIAKAMVITDTRVPVPAAPSAGLKRWGDDA